MRPIELNRRAWLRHLTLSGVALPLLPTVTCNAGWAAPSPATAAEARARIGAQVYVFQQFHQRQGQRLADHLPAMLEAHAAAGIYQLELMGDLLSNRNLGVLRDVGGRLGIRYPVAYAGWKLYDRDGRAEALGQASALLYNAATLGARFLNLNPQPKAQKARKSDAELAVEAEAIRTIARLARGQGLTLLLHQHDAELMDDARNWRYWLQHTDAADTRICFDTHWAHRAGQDVMALLRECRPRLESLHLRNSRQGDWWERLDDGDLDYRPIAAYLQQTQYKGLLMVELAWEGDTRITRGLAENLRDSRHYVERRFLTSAR
ncbi:MAG: sugar phosphate isomerase/epimerase [Bryobacterales bacterium]|nr:sugar phosphate isomerase/epimerase [Bryobacterales bacterium]